MSEVIASFGLSLRRACRITGWNRSSLQYQCSGRDDGALRERLRHWAALKPRWGAPILHDLLKAEGLVINHKRPEFTGRSLRLNQHWFNSLAEARLLIEQWRSVDYNRLRPHSSIGRIPLIPLPCPSSTNNLIHQLSSLNKWPNLLG